MAFIVHSMKSQRQTEVKEMNMTTLTIQQLEQDIAELKNAIEKGWAKGQEAELETMEQQLTDMRLAESESVQEPAKEGADTNTQPIVQDATNDQHEVPKADSKVDETILQFNKPEAPVITENTSVPGLDVECDANIADQMQDNLKVIESLKFKDEAIKNFFAMLPKAACLAKWVGEAKVAVRVKEESFAAKIAETVLLPSFMVYESDRELGKEMKEAQTKTKYLPISILPKELKRDTRLEYTDPLGNKYEPAILQGYKLITHVDTMKYVYNKSDNITYFEGIFEDEIIDTSKDGYKGSDSLVLGIRYKQQKWIEENEATIVAIKDKLIAVKPNNISEAIYTNWVGVLIIASLWDKDVFNNTWQLMLDMALTQDLEPKVKLACALSLVVPELEIFLTQFNAQKDAVPSSFLKSLLKNKGMADTEFSGAFSAIGLTLQENKTGLTTTKLKDAYLQHLDYDDKRVQKYFNTHTKAA